jgi:hypothetical protein
MDLRQRSELAPSPSSLFNLLTAASWMGKMLVVRRSWFAYVMMMSGSIYSTNSRAMCIDVSVPLVLRNFKSGPQFLKL